ECVNYNFPYWFCGNYLQFATRENQMPFDQHSVVALVAPRPIYIASASEDNWADPHGEFLGGLYASPAYELYGKKGLAIQEMPAIDVPSTEGNIAYHIRTGRHAVLPYDWQQFILFAKKWW
ncbi:MAG: acetylxylan esterase, partial [Prevotella sp.]|nr:acetylxylan esterase [Prevotella sp.]